MAAMPSEKQTAAPPGIPDELGGDPRSVHPSLARTALSSTALWIGLALVVIAAFFGMLTPNHAFIQPSNLLDMGLNGSQVMLLAVGMAFVLGMGELDLAVGTNLILSSVIAAKVVVWLSGVLDIANVASPGFILLVGTGIITSVACGAIYGFANAWLVTKLHLHSFIVTLATMGIGLGIALIITTGANVLGLPRQLQTGFGAALLFGVIPLPFLIALAICAAMGLLLRYSRYGLRTLAAGSDREATRRAGIGMQRTLVTPFVVLGGLAGLAGFLDISRFATTNISGHTTDNLAAIAAAVIGGTSLFGGRASVLGAVAGTFIPVFLSTGLIMLGIENYYQLVAVGLILLIAVYTDERRRNPAEST